MYYHIQQVMFIGALALETLATFPDNDPKYKDADSIELLKDVYHKAKKRDMNWVI